jgi:hypothetical protein
MLIKRPVILLCDVYALPNIINVIKSRRLRWRRCVSHIEQNRNSYSVWVRKCEGKRQLGRPERRWEYILK